MNNDWKLIVIKSLREEMKSVLNSLSPENIFEIEDTIAEQFEAARAILGITAKEVEKEAPSDHSEPIETEEKNDEKEPPIERPTYKIREIEPKEPEKEAAPKEQEEKEENNDPIETFAKSFDSKVEPTSYKMKRNLTGGSLQGSNVPFVPERVIREKGFEDGDWISAELINYYNNKPMYEFTLVEKGVVTTKRNVFEFGLVDYDEELRSYFVEENASGEAIKLEDTPQKMIISPHVAERLKLRVGDIVDLAWYGDSMNKFTVSWKYSIDEKKEIEKSVEQKILDHRKSEKPTKEQLDQLKKTFGIKRTENRNLDGLIVTVVGGYSFHTNYKEVVEQNGGEGNFIPENSHLLRMTSAIKRSNLVIINEDHVSHRDMYAAKERAKKYNVPFKVISGLGRSNLLNTLVKEKQAILEEA